MNLICLNLSKIFDIVPQGKLLLRNEKIGINSKNCEVDKKLAEVEASVNYFKGKVTRLKRSLVPFLKVWSGEQSCLISQLVTLLQERGGCNYKICG